MFLGIPSRMEFLKHYHYLNFSLGSYGFTTLDSIKNSINEEIYN